MDEANDDRAPVDQAFLDRIGLSRAEFETVVASGIFDREFYLTNYLDIRAAGIDPLEHYLMTGRLENRRPNAFFDSVEYLELNPDLRNCGIEPFLHYVLIGKKAGLPGSRAEVIHRILSNGLATGPQGEDAPERP